MAIEMQKGWMISLIFIFIFSTVAPIGGGLTANAATASSVGLGTADDPHMISTAEQLAAIGTGGYALDDHYELINDIDLASYNNGGGWYPIGSIVNPFSGTFDGKGFVIKNLTIDRMGRSEEGLFGHSSGTIKNVGMNDADIKSYWNVGVLVGSNEGSIENTYSTGKVTISDFNAGGLAGINTGIIENSFSSVVVTSRSNAGGLVGKNNGTVTNTYATGDVTSKDPVTYAGGLVGLQEINGRVINSYARGIVTSETYSDGLVNNNLGSVINSYWDTVTSEIEPHSSSKGIGKSTAEMKQKSTYSDWDFNSIWEIEEGKVYPRLTNLPSEVQTDVAPPTLDRAVIKNEKPSQLVLIFDEKINITDTKGMTVYVNGNAVTASVEEIENNIIKLTLDKAPEYGQTVMVSYVQSEGSIQDLMGNDLYSFSDKDVTIIASSDATLSNLEILPGSLNEKFPNGGTEKDGTISFTANVENHVDKITIKPTAADEHAKVMVNEESTKTINLNVGKNMITIQVIAEDGTEKTYTLNVTRRSSNSAGNVPDEPTLTVENTTSSHVHLSWGSIHNADGYILKRDGEIIYEGSKTHFEDEDLGSNTNYTYSLLARNNLGNSDEVKVTVRTYSSNANLSNIEINEGMFHPIFEPNISEYSLTVSNRIRSIHVKPTADHEGAMVAINDQIVTSDEISNPIHLGVGDNAITIEVTAEDGTKKIYTINVTRSSAISGGSSGGGGSPPLPTSPSELDESEEPKEDPSYEEHTIGKNGGTISFEDVQMDIPAGAIDGNVTIKVEKVSKLNDEWQPQHSVIIGDIFAFTKDNEGNFKKNITITLPFNMSDADLDTQHISLYWLNEKTGQWIELDHTSINTENGTVSGDINHFTKFAILSKDIHFQDGAYIKGFPDGTFRPESSLTRADMAIILARISGFGNKEMNASFQDVSLKHYAFDEIGYVHKKGLMKGYHDGSFLPDAWITRAEMATVVANYKRFSIEKNVSLAFEDAKGHWAQWIIEANRESGIINGYTDGTFRPNESITRAEAVTMINRMIERGSLSSVPNSSFPDVPLTHWASNDIESATQNYNTIIDENGNHRLLENN